MQQTKIEPDLIAYFALSTAIKVIATEAGHDEQVIMAGFLKSSIDLANSEPDSFELLKLNREKLQAMINGLSA